ncbi:MAG: hypothetical protein KDA92_22320 [Planctomycetales bacterium]|nr:hypothetical protein [Planctomycetales bacterium]
MRVVYLRYLAILSMVGPGCRLAENAVRTTIVEPIQYSRNAYEKLTHKEFIELAQASLDQAISVRRAEMDNFACDPYSPDYCEGYIDGFVDYLEGGGNGEPPALPPRRYWKATYQSFAGHQAAEHWFAGYRHGAESASMTSYRSLVTVPLSDAIVDDTYPYPYGRMFAAQPEHGEVLPKPSPQQEDTDQDRVADNRAKRSWFRRSENREPAESAGADLDSLQPTEMIPSPEGN